MVHMGNVRYIIWVVKRVRNHDPRSHGVRITTKVLAGAVQLEGVVGSCAGWEPTERAGRMILRTWRAQGLAGEPWVGGTAHRLLFDIRLFHLAGKFPHCLRGVRGHGRQRPHLPHQILVHGQAGAAVTKEHPPLFPRHEWLLPKL